MKPWYKSKIIWFGIFQIAMAAITESTQTTSTWQSIALAGIGAATITLRTITTQKIGGKQ